MRYAARGKITKPIEEEMVRQAYHPEQGRRTNSNAENPKFKAKVSLPNCVVLPEASRRRVENREFPACVWRYLGGYNV